MSEDVQLQELIINTLTKEQYEPLTPAENEIYLVEDNAEYATLEDLAVKKEFFPEYKIDNQKTVFDRIAKAKRSTFDRSKFTVVGSPTISDDGVASGFSGSNYLKTNVPELANSINFKITTKFKITDINNYGFVFADALGTSYGITIWQEFGVLKFRQGTTSTSLTSILNDDDLEVIITAQSTVSAHVICYKNANKVYDNNISMNMQNWSGGIWIGTRYADVLGSAWKGSIDLKHFSITVDGVEVFNGNKTGIDQITSTLEIPYTLSKTGSKIVDAVYRDRVQNMYEQFGYTHYYTIGDNDYTLATVPNEQIVDSYYADNSFMELTADLSLTQGGGAVSGQTVNLKRPYVNNKYIATIGTSSKATNSFVASASGQWITKGKGVLG